MDAPKLATFSCQVVLTGCLLVTGCTGSTTAVPTAADAAAASAGNVTYGGLTLGVTDPGTSHDLGITFDPPNVVMSSKAPASAAQSVDYMVSRNQDTQDVFHVLGTPTNGGFSVHVPILRFKAGDYTIKAFTQDSPTPFGQAGLHITSDLLAHRASKT
jgi:hypothetical protein